MHQAEDPLRQPRVCKALMGESLCVGQWGGIRCCRKSAESGLNETINGRWAQGVLCLTYSPKEDGGTGAMLASLLVTARPTGF